MKIKLGKGMEYTIYGESFVPSKTRKMCTLGIVFPYSQALRSEEKLTKKKIKELKLILEEALKDFELYE